MSAPETLFCWNYQTADGGWEKEWGGYARKNHLAPLDQRERDTGALYRRADLPPGLSAALAVPEVAALVEALRQIKREFSGTPNGHRAEAIASAALAAIDAGVNHG